MSRNSYMKDMSTNCDQVSLIDVIGDDDVDNDGLLETCSFGNEDDLFRSPKSEKTKLVDVSGYDDDGEGIVGDANAHMADNDDDDSDLEIHSDLGDELDMLDDDIGEGEALAHSLADGFLFDFDKADQVQEQDQMALHLGTGNFSNENAVNFRHNAKPKAPVRTSSSQRLMTKKGISESSIDEERLFSPSLGGIGLTDQSELGTSNFTISASKNARPPPRRVQSSNVYLESSYHNNLTSQPSHGAKVNMAPRVPSRSQSAMPFVNSFQNTTMTNQQNTSLFQQDNLQHTQSQQQLLLQQQQQQLLHQQEQLQRRLQQREQMTQFQMQEQQLKLQQQQLQDEQIQRQHVQQQLQQQQQLIQQQILRQQQELQQHHQQFQLQQQHIVNPQQQIEYQQQLQQQQYLGKATLSQEQLLPHQFQMQQQQHQSLNISEQHQQRQEQFHDIQQQQQQMQLLALQQQQFQQNNNQANHQPSLSLNNFQQINQIQPTPLSHQVQQQLSMTRQQMDSDSMNHMMPLGMSQMNPNRSFNLRTPRRADSLNLAPHGQVAHGSNLGVVRTSSATTKTTAIDFHTSTTGFESGASGPTLNVAMEKLCDTMKRSAMTRSIVKQLSGSGVGQGASNFMMGRQHSNNTLLPAQIVESSATNMQQFLDSSQRGMNIDGNMMSGISIPPHQVVANMNTQSFQHSHPDLMGQQNVVNSVYPVSLGPGSQTMY